MPKTQLLTQPNVDETRSLSPVGGNQRGALPPEPSPVQFQRQERQPQASGGTTMRPRIVVPVSMAEPQKLQARDEQENFQTAPVRKAQTEIIPNTPVKPQERASFVPRKSWFTEHARPWIVALLLLAGFALLLLGIQYQVRSRQRNSPAGATTASAPAANTSALQIGREMTTTTNLNLRTGAGKTYNRIGEVEGGSRVRILQVSGNWCEVEILERGFPRRGNDQEDRGWIDGTKLR
jgi:hypothetical protein